MVNTKALDLARVTEIEMEKNVHILNVMIAMDLVKALEMAKENHL